MTNINVPTPSLTFEFSYPVSFETNMALDDKLVEVTEVQAHVYGVENGDFNASAKVQARRIQKNGSRPHIVGGTYISFEETRPFVDDAVARIIALTGTTPAAVVTL